MARYPSAKSVPRVEDEEDDGLEDENQEEYEELPRVKKKVQPEQDQVTIEQVLASFDTRLTAIESALFRLRNI